MSALCVVGMLLLLLPLLLVFAMLVGATLATSALQEQEAHDRAALERLTRP